MRLTIRPVAAASAVAITLASIAVIPAFAPQANAAVTTVLSEDFESGSIGQLWPSGYSEFGPEAFVADPDDAENTVLSLTERTENYFSVSTPGAGEMLVEGVEHSVSVRVRLGSPDDSPTTVAIADNVSYSAIIGADASADVTASAWTTLVGTYTPGAANTNVYVAAPAGVDLLVDDFVVTTGTDDAGGEGELCPPTGEVLATHGFEEGVNGWQGRGAATAVVTDAEAHTGAQSLAVTGRTQNWHGTQLPVASVFTEGTYTVSAWVKLPADAAAGTTLKMTVQGNDGTDDTYTEVTPATAVDGAAWVNLCGTYSVIDGDAPSVLYLEAADATASFLVDDVQISGAGAVTEPEPCEPLTSIDFEDGTTGSWIANDAATLTVVDDAGDQVLEVTDRTATHFGIQSPTGEFESGVVYSFSAEVLLTADADVRWIAYDESTQDTYNWAGTASVTAGEWTTVTGTWTFDEASIGTARAYIEVASTDDYRVDDITVSAPCVDGDGPAPGTVAFSTDFENGSLDGWQLRDSGWSEEDEGGALPGVPTVELTEEQSASPTHSAKVSGRNAQGDGIRYEVTDELVAGAQYRVTGSFRFADGEQPGDIWMTLQNGQAFNTLSQFADVTFSNSGWATATATFTMPAVAEGTQAWLYFETAYDGGAKGNTSTFYMDDISAVVPEPAVIEDLTPIKDTVPFPAGVAIDSRETVGAPADLLLRHFNQISAENFMKPEAWYDADGNWAPNATEIDSLMDFAVDNDLSMYGHVLVWHSQTPAWFFEDESGAPLTDSADDQALLRERMRTHIFNVAEYLSQWGEYGAGNPVVAWDVVNEVIDDSAAYADGMRRSEWYRILGETFVDDAFRFADEAFNDVYGSADSVTMFINDYNTEQSGKRSRYLALIDRVIARGAPIDGIGHQFHVNLSLPVSALQDAIVDASGRGLTQAVTELDVTTGTPESSAKFIDQGYYYRDAFDIFRTYASELYSVTIWGLIDSRSWRDANGGPLVFDDDLQAKPAYYGIVEGSATEQPLPPRLRTANAFAGSVELDGDATTSPIWERLPLLPVEGRGDFQFRWAEDHLTVFVSVDDDSVDASDGLEFTLDGTDYAIDREGDGDADAVVTATTGGYDAVVHLPLVGAGESDTVDFDVRIVDGAETSGWNTPGATGTVTLVEALSYLEVPETDQALVIDGSPEQAWDAAPVVTTDKAVEGSGTAPGEFRTLWRDNTLYIYAEIPDADVDTTGSDPWTHDSVELYVDGGNFKNGSYRYDDTQIRVNADNVVSFGAGDETFQANRVESATTLIDGGWAVEVAVSLLEYGGVGTFHGVDFQVNSAENGARQAIRNWADPTGAGYQSTARWGVAQLVAAEDVGQPGDGDGDGAGGGDSDGGAGDGSGGGDDGPLSEDEVRDSDDGGIDVPATARAGETITVGLGEELAGEATQTFLYSEPSLIGQSIADADGNIRVTIPLDTAPGEHTLAVYAADGSLIGWAALTVLAADGALSSTGAEGYLLPASIALLLVLVGSAMVVRRQGALAER
ncbi:endo-1,4-beta-xylanase [Demequina muriae]|uniref:Beta-xylanase n=1 Tax=Demequina muriae TaxID=3051664 RepID=A0ABT8GKV2_9MICO|nr:endo-1,4-beta-xylanase [Demequina sp. EGI L300058]MDN4481561.1 endo-1,4-beta-xylanase [Demequina sp. EGI L300058]